MGHKEKGPVWGARPKRPAMACCGRIEGQFPFLSVSSNSMINKRFWFFKICEHSRLYASVLFFETGSSTG